MRTAGDNAMIAPTFRSRFGHPSSRLPMPGAKELSTVEWHNAQVVPTLLRLQDIVFPIDLAFKPDHGIEFEQHERGRWTFQIDAAVHYAVLHRLR